MTSMFATVKKIPGIYPFYVDNYVRLYVLFCSPFRLNARQCRDDIFKVGEGVTA